MLNIMGNFNLKLLKIRIRAIEDYLRRVYTLK